MKKHRQRLMAAALIVATAGLGACGLGFIDFGGGGHSGTVIVQGNIDDVIPVTTRDIVVFVFSGKDPSGDSCPAATTTTSTTESTTSTSTSTTMVQAALTAADDTADGGEAAGSSCECPAAPVNPECTPGKAVVLSPDQKDFTVSNVKSGKLRVVFLLDNAGNDADGQIDPGDPIAVLDDVDCKLDDVNGKNTITLTDVDLNFDSEPVEVCEKNVEDPPAAGRARAFTIKKERTPDDN